MQGVRHTPTIEPSPRPYRSFDYDASRGCPGIASISARQDASSHTFKMGLIYTYQVGLMKLCFFCPLGGPFRL